MEKSSTNSKLVSMDKRYKTRDGRSVRIICTDMKGGEHCVVALVQEGECEDIGRYTAEGLFWSSNEESRHDLIEVSPYEDWKVDDLIVVKNNNSDSWEYRHFAGTVNGVPCAWDSGRTSYTSGGYYTLWDEARKPPAEELESIRSKV